MSNWDEIASDYVRVQHLHHALLYPHIIGQVRHATAGSLLDYGGGDGTLLRELDGHVNKLALFEPCRVMRRLAQATCSGIEAQITGSLIDLDDVRFDAIVFCAVWMSLETEEACVEALAWMARHLTPGGVVLVAVTHPCFRHLTHEGYRTNFRIEDYCRVGSSFEVKIRDGDAVVTLQDTHWPLFAMHHQAREAGLVFDHLAEVGPTPAETPPWILASLRAQV